jgi:parafibromin
MRGAACLRALRAYLAKQPNAPCDVNEDGSVTIDGTSYRGDQETGYRSSQAGVGIYSLAAVVLLVRYTKQSEYLRACIARKIRGVVTVDQGDVRALLSGAKEDSDNLEGEEILAPPPVEVSTTAPVEKEEESDDDDPFERNCYSLGDRNKALVCIPGKDFSFASRLWERYVEREKREQKKKDHEEKRASEKLKRDEKLRKKDPVLADKKRARDEAKAESKKKPRTAGTVGIIIVPNAPTALLTLVNAADLLERNTYVTPAEKRQQGAKKEPIVKVSRTRADGVVQSFKLVDDPRRLSDGDWKRVVAVVAQGAAWQFKGWKINKPVDLFNQYLGVHVKFDDTETPKDVKKWNVSVVSVNKHKRHLDPTAAHSFWRLVDDHVARRRKEKPTAPSKRRK